MTNKYLEKIAAQYGVKSPYYLHGSSVIMNDNEHNKYLDAMKKHDTAGNYLKTVGKSVAGYGLVGAGAGALLANPGMKRTGAAIGGYLGATVGSLAAGFHHKSNMKLKGLEKAIGNKKIDHMVTLDKVN